MLKTDANIEQQQGSGVYCKRASLFNIARGVDIPNLQKITLFVPGYVASLDDIGLNQTELKQLAGRVGRKGIIGEFYIMFVGYPPDQQRTQFDEKYPALYKQRLLEYQLATSQQLNHNLPVDSDDPTYSAVRDVLRDNFVRNVGTVNRWVHACNLDIGGDLL